MKKIILALFILCWLFPIQFFSQNKVTEKTDYYCSSIDSLIENDGNLHVSFMVHSIDLETNKRAIGRQYTTVKFYYPMPLDSVIESENGTEFIYVYKPPFKINVEYNIAANHKNVIEYYFNEKGKLILYKYLSKGDYGCISLKKYFKKNRLIKDVNLKLSDCNEDNAMTMQQNLLTEVRIIEIVKTYLKMFNTLVRFEQLDK